MNFFIPFDRKNNRGVGERRLRISIVNNYCVINEEFKIKDTWYDGNGEFDTIEFPVKIMLQLAELLQRVEKLLVLK